MKNPSHLGHPDPLEHPRHEEKATSYQGRIIIGFLLMIGVLFLPLDNLKIMEGLDADRVRMGLGIFVCIAFL